jgi:hypothetical protein
MSRKVGFTGTHNGMQAVQLKALVDKLVFLKEEGFDEFHHGWCIGSDEQAAIAAKSIGYRIVAHPGLAKDPKNMLYRSEWNENDEVREAKPFINRDHDIVDETEIMLATPLTWEEQTRSGTWTTIRYAKKQGRAEGETLFIFKPPFMPPAWAKKD